MKKFDFIIIGQGIGGSVLAFSLLKKGKSVLVIDDGYKSSSSFIAAGLWNPIVFKRLSKSWFIDQCIEIAYPFYKELEDELGVSFFHKKRLIRIFPDQRSANDFDEKSENPEYKAYINSTSVSIPDVHQPFGNGIVENAGWCNVPVFINNFREYLIERNAFFLNDFDEEKLVNVDGEWQYENFAAEKIIFSTGSKMLSSKFFGYLPLVPNKGQVLRIKFEDQKVDEMINYGNFLLPVDNGEYRLGATYELNDPNPNITEEARISFLDGLKDILPYTPIVLDHEVGYRPTVRDRRPLLGEHPSHKGMYIFNGLGSKGVIQAPYCAHHLVQHLLEGVVIDKEMSISRFR